MTHTTDARREGFEKVEPHINKNHRGILELLQVRGPLSAWDIQGITGGLITSIRARLSELMDKGLIVAIGRKRDARTNVKVTVYSYNFNPNSGRKPKENKWKDRALKAEGALRLKKLELEGAELRLKRIYDKAKNRIELIESKPPVEEYEQGKVSAFETILNEK